jgi:DNA-binding response OmpR family regulator
MNTSAATTNGNVLVVDDESSLRHTLTRILRQSGCEVTSAADGFEALSLAATTHFDLVYLDIRLPGKDGVQTLRELRQQAPQLPVILLTAYGSLQTALEALRLGATDYLLKPIDPDVLVARTRIVLKEQAVERRRRELREQIEKLQGELSKLEAEYPLESGTPAPEMQSAPAPEDRFLKRGGLILDLLARRATFGAEVISLPPATFDYLAALARHSPNPVDYQTLVTEAQGYQVSTSEARELAKYHIHVLRGAFEADPKQPRHIHNVRGVGYRWLLD